MRKKRFLSTGCTKTALKGNTNGGQVSKVTKKLGPDLSKGAMRPAGKENNVRDVWRPGYSTRIAYKPKRISEIKCGAAQTRKSITYRVTGRQTQS